jgi:preprotein translocase SecE subunit
VAEVDNNKKPKRRIKSAPTIREQTSAATQSHQKSSKTRTEKGIKRLFKATGRGIASLLRPFNFLLWPFRTRIGRVIVKVLGTVLLINFIVGAWRELKGVEWPNRKQTFQLTVAVYMFAIIFGIIIAVIDYGLDRIFKRVLLK